MNLVKKYLNPKNDEAFKCIFGKEKNKDILIKMLNAVLKKQLRNKSIEEIQFLNPQLDPEIMGSKQSIVDVLCQDEDGCKYIIEMQIGHADGFTDRARYYAARAFVDQGHKGDPYYGLKEIIFLAFCDFNIFPDKKHYKSEHVILDNETYEHDLDKFSFTFVDLVKFDKELNKPVKELTDEEKFYYFLCHATDISDEDMALLAKTPALEKAFTALDRYSWSEEEYALYKAAEKRERDYLATLTFQRKEGRKEGKKEVINNLLASGMDKSKLADMLKLTLEELELILKQ